MNYETEILNRLANGEDPVAIGKSFTEALNKVMAQKKTEKQNEARLDKLADNIANDLMEYIHISIPATKDHLEAGVLTGKDLRMIVDAMLPSLKRDLESLYAVKDLTKGKTKNSDEVLTDFLRELGL